MQKTYVPIPLFLGCASGNFPFIEETFDSLTTYKMLCKIAGVVNTIQDYLQDLDFNQYTEYVNEQITNLKIYVDSQDANIKNYVNQQVEQAKNYTDEEIAKLNLSLLQYINTQIQNLKEYSDAQDVLLKNYIDEEVLKLYKEIEEIATKGIKVYNPTTGEYDYLQNTINDLYTYLRYYGITANEFDTLALTAQEFDNKLITARDFDLYAKQILMINWCCKMYSPITGEIEPISKVVNELASLHKNEITAQEFDNLDLTAQEFDDKNISAYDFDWNGKILLSA
jgi:hypothetical protein